MDEETIGVILAATALVGLLVYARFRPTAPTVPVGSTQPVPTTLAQAVDPSQLDSGPSYFIANQPYYFAPPIGNMMPQAVSSNTIATNDDGGCGCGG